HHPLFQVMFSLQNESAALDLPGLALQPLDVEYGTTQFDLSLSVEEIGTSIGGVLGYRSDLFDAGTIARMEGHFQTLLEQIVAHPEHRIAELSLLTGAERQQLLVDWNATAALYPHDLCA